MKINLNCKTFIFLQSEVEETIKRLSSHKGVEGIVIVNMEGIPIRTTLDHEKTIQHSALITQLTAKAKSVIRDLDPQVGCFAELMVYGVCLKPDSPISSTATRTT